MSQKRIPIECLCGNCFPCRIRRSLNTFSRFGVILSVFEAFWWISLSTPPHTPPLRSVEHFFGVGKIKNCKLLLSDAATSLGNLITHPHVGVPGAHGSNARARRAVAGELFEI